MKHRILALVLALVMLFTVCPVSALAEASKTGHIDLGRSEVVTNPLYPDLNPNVALQFPVGAEGSDNAPVTKYGTKAEMAEDIQQYMKSRSTYFNLALEIYIPRNTDVNTAIQDAVTEAFEDALVHTGVPTEGDYLRWHWGHYQWEGSADVSGNTYYVDIQFAIDYYTTASQEAALDQEVDRLLNRLNLYNATDYEKVRGIYDYICDNITYDYNNLENDSYTLKYSAYAALMYGTAICQGYANLFYRLALELGVDTRFISGIGGGGPHGWNIVELENLYYNLDSTWDAGTNGNYSYFLVTDGNFHDHTRDPEYSTSAFYNEYPMGSKNYTPSAGTTDPTVPTEPVEPDPSNAFVRINVSKASDVGAGTYLIYGTSSQETDNGTKAAFMSTESASSSRLSASYFTIKNDSVDTEDTYSMWKLISTSGGFYVQNVANQKYLYYGTGKDSNAIYQTSDIYEAGVWTVFSNNNGWTLRETASGRQLSCNRFGSKGSYYLGFAAYENETNDYSSTLRSLEFFKLSEESTPDEPPVHTHKYAKTVTPPTCTDQGYTTYVCECGDRYTGDYTAALGHNWDNGIITKQPTEKEEGIKTFTCARCGETRLESIPKIEPQPTEPDPTEPAPTEPAPTEPAPTEPVPDDPGHTHSYGAWYLIYEPSSKTEGLERRDCSCGDSQTRIVPCLVNPFTDVPNNRYFFEPILWAVNHGITSGLTQTAFGPNESCTRAQIVMFLWCAHGRPEPKSLSNPFTDVQAGKYYYKAVLWAVENGITSGVTQTRFGPNQTCTRAQVVTFLWASQGRPEPVSYENYFSDVRSDRYYFRAVLWAVQNDITTGVGYGKFGPNQTCTRAQIVTFLYNTLSGPTMPEDAVLPEEVLPPESAIPHDKYLVAAHVMNYLWEQADAASDIFIENIYYTQRNNAGYPMIIVESIYLNRAGELARMYATGLVSGTDTAPVCGHTYLVNQSYCVGCDVYSSFSYPSLAGFENLDVDQCIRVFENTSFNSARNADLQFIVK